MRPTPLYRPRLLRRGCTQSDMHIDCDCWGCECMTVGILENIMTAEFAEALRLTIVRGAMLEGLANIVDLLKLVKQSIRPRKVNDNLGCLDGLREPMTAAQPFSDALAVLDPSEKLMRRIQSRMEHGCQSSHSWHISRRGSSQKVGKHDQLRRHEGSSYARDIPSADTKLRSAR